MKYHYIPIRLSKIKKIATTQNDDENAEKLDDSYIASGNVKWYGHCGKQCGSFFKNKTCNSFMTLHYTLRHLFQRRDSLCSHKNV